MMTIANMIENGTSWIWVICGCGHQGKVDVGSWDQELFIPMLRRKFTCPHCGKKPAETVPAWDERTGRHRPPNYIGFDGTPER